MSSKEMGLKSAVSVLVRARLNALSAKTFHELAELPDQRGEAVMVEGKRVTLSVWHDVLASQEHRIVVQVHQPGTLGVGRMHADGFVVNDQNKQRSLTQDEWAPFS